MAAYGQRIRAARAWKGLSQRELGEALGLDEQTIKRREADKQQPKDGELIAIAQICDVPLAFLRDGFDGMTPNEGRPDRAMLESIHHEVVEHRTATEEVIAKRLVQHVEFTATVEEHRQMMVRLLRLGHRIEGLLSPSAGDQFDRAVDALEAPLPDEPPGSAAGESGSRHAQGGQG